MDRFNIDHEPASMLFPYTFSFPFIRSRRLPKEFDSFRLESDLTESVYPLSFDFYLPPYR